MKKTLLMLDRDGCLNVPKKTSRYIENIADFILYDDVIDSLKAFRNNDVFKYFGVITNQQGISNGLYSMDDVIAMHNKLCELTSIPRELFPIFVCSHKVDTCLCRKPSPTLLIECMRFFKVANGEALFIGDSVTDYLAAKNANIDFIYINRDGSQYLPSENCVTISSFKDLLDIY